MSTAPSIDAFVERLNALRHKFPKRKPRIAIAPTVRTESVPTVETLVNRINLIMKTPGALDALKQDHERYSHFLHAYKRVGSRLPPTQYIESAQEVMKPLRVNYVYI